MAGSRTAFYDFCSVGMSAPRARVLEHFEDVDVVVNNAGACLTGTFSATAVEDFRAQMDVVSVEQRPADALQASSLDADCVAPLAARRMPSLGTCD